MSVMSALFDNGAYNSEQAFGACDITSSEMRSAIRDWYGLYYDNVLTEHEDPCQRLPYTIVNKLTRTTFSEYDAQPAKASGKAPFIASLLLSLDRVRKKAMQQAQIGGECFIKPIITSSGIQFRVVSRRNYLVFGRNERDEITDIGTTEHTGAEKMIYTLLERRTIDSAGRLTIINRLFRSSQPSTLGTEVPLTELDKYSALPPVLTFPQPFWSLGLIPLRMPMENCVDGSPDGVSVYAPAAGLIHNININERQIGGEFERGESRIIASADLLRVSDNGTRKLDDHLFVGLDDDPDRVGVTIFSPTLREQSFLARKTEYLRNIETLIGIKRGILSEVESAERTATEITSSAGDYNLTIIDLQEMWERAVRETIRVCNLLGQYYRLCDESVIDPEKDVVISWGNGILYDEDKVWTDYKAMVASGMLKPELALAWYFNMPAETPEDLQRVREKYMPEMEAMLGDDE